MPAEPWDEFSERLRDIETAERAPDIISPYLALPGLRGFWPMSSVGVAGQAIDLQGLGNHLTWQGNPMFHFAGLAPFCRYDGTGDYHDITDAASANAFDIRGLEAYINDSDSALGLTLGGWIYPEETSTLEFIITKWAPDPGFAYRVILGATDIFAFEISDDGSNTDIVTSAVVTMNAWYFVAGRFIPSTSVDIFVNGVETNQATARPSIADSPADFAIGARGDGAIPFQGRVSLAFICAMAHSDSIINSLFQQTRSAFGV